MNKTTIDKISRFLLNEFNNNLSNISFFQNIDGTYEIFGRYYVKKHNLGYKVTSLNRSKEVFFSDLRNAVAWCIFDYTNKFFKSSRVEYIDSMLSGLDLNIQIHKRLIKNTKDIDNKLIFVAKLYEDQLRKKHYLDEMQTYINESRILQTKKFSS